MEWLFMNYIFDGEGIENDDKKDKLNYILNTSMNMLELSMGDFERVHYNRVWATYDYEKHIYTQQIMEE